MDELDEVWSQMLENALAEAKTAGRGDVADYLALKASNDRIRQTAVKWLFDTMTEIAAHANRKNANITIENENPHAFTYHHANLVGSLLRFRQGVRCLTVEAGWTRAPQDGFMRGGALAAARITHFGMSKSNAELHLLRFEAKPHWFAVERDGMRTSFEVEDLIRHFQIFLK
jgi:hypothetical protein